jgi:hypothetical protein
MELVAARGRLKCVTHALQGDLGPVHSVVEGLVRGLVVGSMSSICPLQSGY